MQGAIQHRKTAAKEQTIDMKIQTAAEGLAPEYYRSIKKLSNKQNALTIADYLASMKSETNLSDNYRKSIIKITSIFSAFCKNRPFKSVTRKDFLSYLNCVRKPEKDDPMHKWIGTYNYYNTILTKFFRWLYNPDMSSNTRPKPPVVENIPLLKRREVSIYKPTDLWTIADDLLFLKYCPSKRIKCYHTVSRDSSCRPNEILKLKVRDIVFKLTPDKTKQYAEVLVNGKTGTRSIPLFDSIPYVKDYLDHEHPQPGNPNAPFICGLRRSIGKSIGVNQLYMIYDDYKEKYFPKLLENPNIPPEDKQKIKELLKKPWNPYIRRHTGLTEKSLKIPGLMNQYAGWTQGSAMAEKYFHYFGNESSNGLLEAYGIVTKDQKVSDVLKPKSCPHCSESNKYDSKFCAKCRMVLTYDAYSETLEDQKEKESEIQRLQGKYEQDMKAMREEMKQQFTQIMSMIQQNPQLAHIKPEALTTKTITR